MTKSVGRSSMIEPYIGDPGDESTFDEESAAELAESYCPSDEMPA